MNVLVLSPKVMSFSGKCMFVNVDALVLFWVCFGCNKGFAKLSTHPCVSESFANGNLVNNLQSMGLSDEFRYTRSTVLPAAFLSLEGPSYKLTKPEVFAEMCCGLESLN